MNRQGAPAAYNIGKNTMQTIVTDIINAITSSNGIYRTIQ